MVPVTVVGMVTAKLRLIDSTIQLAIFVTLFIPEKFLVKHAILEEWKRYVGFIFQTKEKRKHSPLQSQWTESNQSASTWKKIALVNYVKIKDKYLN